MRKILYFLLLILLVLPISVYATNNPQTHNASSIYPQTFTAGDFVFREDVNASYFRGRFNWSIISGFLSWTGSVLDFSSSKFNTTFTSLLLANRSKTVSFVQNVNVGSTLSTAAISLSGTLDANSNQLRELSQLYMTNGGWIGDLAANNPRITFDSTNNEIEITDANVTMGSNSITGGYIFSAKNMTAKWFKGLFNWSASSSFLSWTGSVLGFNSAKLNATIISLNIGNTTTELSNFLSTNRSKDVFFGDSVKIADSLNVSNSIKLKNNTYVGNPNAHINFTAEEQEIIFEGGFYLRTKNIDGMTGIYNNLGLTDEVNVYVLTTDSTNVTIKGIVAPTGVSSNTTAARVIHIYNAGYYGGGDSGSFILSRNDQQATSSNRFYWKRNQNIYLLPYGTITLMYINGQWRPFGGDYAWG